MNLQLRVDNLTMPHDENVIDIDGCGKFANFYCKKLKIKFFKMTKFEFFAIF